jgi:O-antigen/teichoic acid export membrane protein
MGDVGAGLDSRPGDTDLAVDLSLEGAAASRAPSIAGRHREGLGTCDSGNATASDARPRQALADSALWLLVSNLLYSACQWGAIAAIAKLGAPNALGHYGLASAVAAPVVVASGLALRAFQATDVLRRYAFADYLQLRLLANLVAGGLIGCAALAGMVNADATSVLVPIAVARLAEVTSETCYGSAQRHDRMRFVAVSTAARGALGLAALVAVFALGGTLATAVWALAACWIAFLLVIDLRAAGALEPLLATPEPARLWRLLRECTPLGALAGISVLTQSVPRYLLQASRGAAAVGFFTALSGVQPAIAQLSAALGHAAAPHLGWNAAGDARGYRRLVLRLLGGSALLCGVMTLGAALVGRRFLALAYTPEYAAYETAFVLLVLGAGLSIVNTMAYFALLAVRRTTLQLAIFCAGLVGTAVTGVALVPSLGVLGAAAAVAVGAVTMAAIAAGALIRQGAR